MYLDHTDPDHNNQQGPQSAESLQTSNHQNPVNHFTSSSPLFQIANRQKVQNLNFFLPFSHQIPLHSSQSIGVREGSHPASGMFEHIDIGGAEEVAGMRRGRAEDFTVEPPALQIVGASSKEMPKAEAGWIDASVHGR
ncbi:MAG: hypothetical protein LQ338_002323 [Usnochroma carphineum]|nr:MAG: hypothetical protein LQ338_002323 [Usnochroma carphineum]